MKYILSALLIVSLLAFAGCGGDDDGPSAREEFINDLAQTWWIDQSDESVSIQLDGQEVTSIFADFEITINTDLTYTTNSDILAVESFPWPQSGSFTLTGDLKELVRDDGLIINVELTDETLLSLSFIYDSGFDNAGGRQQAVLGTWLFVMKKR